MNEQAFCEGFAVRSESIDQQTERETPFHKGIKSTTESIKVEHTEVLI